MRIITISREFGSGGRELGKRLAEQMNYQYYDREIITAIAKESDLDTNYVENALEKPVWQLSTQTFRQSFATPVLFQDAQLDLLTAQRNVLHGIASKGEDCVIVGRNADVILRDYQPMSIFVCANLEAKLIRCRERASKDENLSDKQMIKKLQEIDKNRAKVREMLTDEKWGDRCAYDLIVNTSGWKIKELTPAIAEYAIRWFNRT